MASKAEPSPSGAVPGQDNSNEQSQDGGAAPRPPTGPSPDRYIYSELPSGNYIRYFVLEPGQADEALKGNLYVCHIDEAPNFEAISYVWGDMDRGSGVSCGGNTVYVTNNLQEALRRIRLPSRERFLWADSICIDQDNLRERGHQVALMRRIYSKAERVLIYCGEDTHGIAQDVDSLLSEVNAMIESQLNAAGMVPDKMAYPKPGDRLLSDARWEAVRRFVRETPWFKRGWVIQEAAFAKEATVLWGSTEIALLSLLQPVTWAWNRAPSIYYQNLNRVNVLLRQNYELRFPERVRCMDAQFKLDSPAEIMFRASRLSLTDPRDYVYAFLGLIEHRTNLAVPLVPDYGKPCLDVYHDFARLYLSLHNDLRLLSCIKHDGRSLATALPSWVPRWNEGLRPARHNDLSRRLRAYMRGSPKLTFLSDHHLQLRGVFFDVPSFISGPFPIDINLFRELAQLWNHVCAPSFRTNIIYPPNARFTAFIDCLHRTHVIENWHAEIRAFIRAMLEEGAKFDKGILEFEENSFEPQDYELDEATLPDEIHRSLTGHRFCVSERGHFSLVPEETTEGDLFCILYGAQHPFILRAADTLGEYKLVGPCYCIGSNGDFAEIYGQTVWKYYLLYGNGFNDAEWFRWKLKEQDIVIV